MTVTPNKHHINLEVSKSCMFQCLKGFLLYFCNTTLASTVSIDKIKKSVTFVYFSQLVKLFECRLARRSSNDSLFTFKVKLRSSRSLGYVYVQATFAVVVLNLSLVRYNIS